MVDGLLTTYDVSGEGNALLLLHGWGDKSVNLGAPFKPLAKHYRLINVDLPGFGGTASPSEPWDLTNYATFVAHFLDKIGEQKLLGIIGHSNGGAIAIRAVGRGIISADKLVLLASAGVRGSYNTRSKAQRLIVKAGKLVITPLPARLKHRIRRRVYDAIGSDMFVAEHLQETFKRVVTDDVQADAAKIAVPTLLIYGETDLATPVAYGEMFHQLIHDSTLEVLPGAGHFVQLDRTNEVVTSVEEFL